MHNPPSGIDPLLTDKQIAAVLKVSDKTIKRERRLGRMPPAVRVTPRKIGTRRSLFLQWLQDKERESSEEAAAALARAMAQK
jgi:predicted DNA-binding transcriptional regulator AlpA